MVTAPTDLPRPVLYVVCTYTVLHAPSYNCMRVGRMAVIEKTPLLAGVQLMLPVAVRLRITKVLRYHAGCQLSAEAMAVMGNFFQVDTVVDVRLTAGRLHRMEVPTEQPSADPLTRYDWMTNFFTDFCLAVTNWSRCY